MDRRKVTAETLDRFHPFAPAKREVVEQEDGISPPEPVRGRRQLNVRLSEPGWVRLAALKRYFCLSANSTLEVVLSEMVRRLELDKPQVTGAAARQMILDKADALLEKEIDAGPQQ